MSGSCIGGVKERRPTYEDTRDEGLGRDIFPSSLSVLSSNEKLTGRSLLDVEGMGVLARPKTGRNHSVILSDVEQSDFEKLMLFGRGERRAIKDGEVDKGRSIGWCRGSLESEGKMEKLSTGSELDKEEEM